MKTPEKERETERSKDEKNGEKNTKIVWNALHDYYSFFFLSVLTSNYSTWWREGFAHSRGGIARFYFCQYFGVSAWHFSTSFLDSLLEKESIKNGQKNTLRFKRQLLKP